MTDIGMFIWKLTAMPTAANLIPILLEYKIKRVAIKVAEGSLTFNAPEGDKPLMDYIQTLRDGGIIVEGWGYHYDENPGAQGDRVEERCEKLKLDTYHFDCEKEWQEPFWHARQDEIITLESKGRRAGKLLCSYRFMTDHPNFPVDATINHEAMDAANPQMYWALRHDPANQLKKCFFEYGKYNKPVYPVGAMFGANFTLNDQTTWWEPSVDEIVEFMTYCEANHVRRVYFWSLDYVLSKRRFDWLAAANWVTVPPIPPDPEPEPDDVKPLGVFTVSSEYRNIRSNPMGSVIGKAMRNSQLPFVQREGEWVYVNGWVWQASNEK